MTPHAWRPLTANAGYSAYECVSCGDRWHGKDPTVMGAATYLRDDDVIAIAKRDPVPPCRRTRDVVRDTSTRPYGYRIASPADTASAERLKAKRRDWQAAWQRRTVAKSATTGLTPAR